MWEAAGGTRSPMATQASGATCVPVSHGVVFGAAKRIVSRDGVPVHGRAPNKKPVKPYAVTGFWISKDSLGRAFGAGDRT